MAGVIAIRQVWILGETPDEDGHYEHECSGCGASWADQLDVPDDHQCPPLATYASTCGQDGRPIPWETQSPVRTAIYGEYPTVLTWGDRTAPTHLGFRAVAGSDPAPATRLMGGYTFHLVEA